MFFKKFIMVNKKNILPLFIHINKNEKKTTKKRFVHYTYIYTYTYLTIHTQIFVYV